jgi:hypothetical protein
MGRQAEWQKNREAKLKKNGFATTCPDSFGRSTDLSRFLSGNIEETYKLATMRINNSINTGQKF